MDSERALSGRVRKRRRKGPSKMIREAVSRFVSSTNNEKEDTVTILNSSLSNNTSTNSITNVPSLPKPYLAPTISYIHRIVSLDCEMVGVGPELKSALARCSIVSYSGHVLYDEYVRPNLPITDYRSRWSGIRPNHMCHALSMSTAITQIRHILEGKILIGHSLHNDFNVLGFQHPEKDVRDTSCYKLIRINAGLPVENPPSLRKLAMILLNRTIQRGSHCSVEDARTSLDIYKQFETQWEEEIASRYRNWFSDKYWPSDLASVQIC